MSVVPVNLEDVIRSHIQLDRPNSKGWCNVLCKVCGDRGHKGKRAAFNFSDQAVSYHCFNCGHVAVFDPKQNPEIDERMIKVLHAFGVPDQDWKSIYLNELYVRNLKGNFQPGLKLINNVKIEPAEIPLPSHFYKLGPDDSTDKWTIIARDYLQTNRGVDPDGYPFYLSTGEGEKENQKWVGRVIIPFYKNEKLIYYQGRSLVGSAVRKYLSPDFEKTRVMGCFDNLFHDTDAPLYVVEGWFDAYSIDGVAVLGNTMSEEHNAWLAKSPRPKVIIPDRYGDGARLAYQALKQNWAVSIPDCLSRGDCKDVNEAVVKYGKLYVLKDIVEHTATGIMAETAIKLHCKKKR
jgi:hypothetical protein